MWLSYPQEINLSPRFCDLKRFLKDSVLRRSLFSKFPSIDVCFFFRFVSKLSLAVSLVRRVLFLLFRPQDNSSSWRFFLETFIFAALSTKYFFGLLFQSCSYAIKTFRFSFLKSDPHYVRFSWNFPLQFQLQDFHIITLVGQIIIIFTSK